MNKDTPHYRPAQRLVALVSGLICHLTFAAAVAVMALALFSGLRIGIGPFRGGASLVANALLLASFPLTHSGLLSPKGRRFMARLVPLGIGAKLFWTVFATISSFQLLTVFLLWSPSGIVWWQATGGVRIVLGVAALAAWLLLGKSMFDAQLGVQTGYVGWSSVFLNRKASYKPFATDGLYTYVRQPIYISFAMLLWLTAAWTPDQLVFAIAWTGYCVVGSAIKEKRFLRCFGDAFRTYQTQVPFWIPNRPKKPEPVPNRTADADIMIMGAGPVGLLLANQLGQRGHRVIVTERRTRPRKGSMAIGITPPSLLLLKELGLDREFTQRGIPITTAKVFEQGNLLGNVDFSKLQAQHRYILSLPQSETIAILKRNLKKYPRVLLLEGREFMEYQSASNGIIVRLRDSINAAYTEYFAPYLVGCDGHNSAVRRQTRIPFPGRNYRSQFFMADFTDHTAFASEAHLYFGPRGSVESFPLSGGKRRWIVQTPLRMRPDQVNIGSRVSKKVFHRTGIDLSTSDLQFESSFRPQRRLAGTYFKDRVLLCGDAAHVMSPIGGQGMNTGFADAAHLSRALTDALEHPEQARSLFTDYSLTRRIAFRCAAARAARGMWLGTRTGILYSALRKVFTRKILFSPSVRERIAPYFAMLTIPGNPLSSSPAPRQTGVPST